MKRILPFIVLIIICLVFYYPTITRGMLPTPTDTLIGLYYPWRDLYAETNPSGVPYKNFLITDPIRQQIPWRKLTVDSFKTGKFPTWNPYNFSGTPLAANIQAGIWYPLNIFFLLLPFHVAWTVLVVAQTVLGALFLYLFLRHKSISEWTSVIFSVVWAFCGFSIAWLTWGTIVQTALWLPLMLLAIDKSQILLLIISSVFAFFAGHAQVALYIYLFACVYAITKRSWKLLAAALVILALTSIQWVPMMQQVLQSSRLTDSSAWIKDGWFLPWQHLIQFVVPDFFGNPATLNYWGVWNYGEFIGYIGILPLIMAIYTLIFIRTRFIVALSVVTGIVFLFLLPTPLAKIPYQLHIPFISSLQPTRLMVIIDFCLVMLAALGFDMFTKKPNKKVLLPIAGIGLTLCAAWIYVAFGSGENLLITRRNLIMPSMLWVCSSFVLLSFVFLKRWKNVLKFLVLFIIMADLFRFGWKFTPFTPVDYFFPNTPIITFLQNQRQPFRVMSLDNKIIPPNVNAYYGLESIEGYDPIYNSRYEEYMAALNRNEPNIRPPFGFNRIITGSSLSSPLLSLLNVKYILSIEPITHPFVELMYQYGNIKVYWNKKGVERMYPVEEVVQARSKEIVIPTLYESAFDAKKTAVIEENLDVVPHPIEATENFSISSYTGISMTAEYSFDNDHYVVIANLYDDTWKAKVDNAETKIYRTNYIFMGIMAPKGSHTITLSYE